VTGAGRDRDAAGRPRNARDRDHLGRPQQRRPDAVAPQDPTPLDPAQALTVAQQLLDDGRPFEAHEVLEGVWKSTTEEPALWRGLAQLAVGVTHRDRGNLRGATALLRRGAETLAPFAGRRADGVDVDGLRGWAEVAAADPEHAPAMPPLRAQAADERS
jgi:uncharacterized protein